MNDKPNWTLAWNFVATIDEKNRFVLPSKLCKNLPEETNELFLILAKSQEFWKYIKLVPEDIFNEKIDLINCDSLKIFKNHNCLEVVKIPTSHRILLSQETKKWLLGNAENCPRKITCIWVQNHIAVTAKNIEEILNQDSI